MHSTPNTQAFCNCLRMQSPQLLGDVADSIRDLVIQETKEGSLCFSINVNSVLESDWSDGPEEAVKAAVAVWGDDVCDHFHDLLSPESAPFWELAGITAAELQEMHAAVRTIRPKLSPESLAALVHAASSKQP